MSEEKPDKNDSKPNNDFHLKEPYQEVCDETIYSDEKRVGKVFGVRDKNTNETFVRFLSESNKFNWKTRKKKWTANYGFNIYEWLHLSKLVSALKSAAATLGWRFPPAEELDQLRERLQQTEHQLVESRFDAARNEEEKQKLLGQYAAKIEQLSKNRLPEFKKDLTELQGLISGFKSKPQSESELQDFLYTRPWLFGLEYLTVQPQKLRGAHSKFDFYLERYNKTNDIVEIKLISDAIINKDETISAKVAQAIDQLIEYLESTQAAAHSRVISEEEGIYELRPRGIVIIGSDNSKAATNKLLKWNYRLAHIKIWTYDEVLQRGKAVIDQIEGIK
jgi:hypothetical protein